MGLRGLTHKSVPTGSSPWSSTSEKTYPCGMSFLLYGQGREPVKRVRKTLGFLWAKAKAPWSSTSEKTYLGGMSFLHIFEKCLTDTFLYAILSIEKMRYRYNYPVREIKDTNCFYPSFLFFQKPLDFSRIIAYNEYRHQVRNVHLERSNPRPA